MESEDADRTNGDRLRGAIETGTGIAVGWELGRMLTGLPMFTFSQPVAHGLGMFVGTFLSALLINYWWPRKGVARHMILKWLSISLGIGFVYALVISLIE